MKWRDHAALRGSPVADVISRSAYALPALVVASTVAGCPSARLIECGRGGELCEIDGAAYCVYGPEDDLPDDGSAICPGELPYPVRCGGYLICAAEMLDPEDLPDELCGEGGTCRGTRDAGSTPDAGVGGRVDASSDDAGVAAGR